MSGVATVTLPVVSSTTRSSNSRYLSEPRFNRSTEFVVRLFGSLDCRKLTSALVVGALESPFRDLSRLELLYVSIADATTLSTKTRITGMDVATIVIAESATDQMTKL